MKANKTYQVQQHGRKTEYKTKKAALNLANELAIYNESDNVSVYEYNHNTGIYTEIYTREYTTPTTSDTMNTETKTRKEVTVTISPDGSDLYAATVNGVTVGSVNTWFNNTFAASYNFGINTRKRLGMPELNNANYAAHGFMTEHNAVLWLGDMIARYFAGYGITANIVNA